MHEVGRVNSYEYHLGEVVGVRMETMETRHPDIVECSLCVPTAMTRLKTKDAHWAQHGQSSSEIEKLDVKRESGILYCVNMACDVTLSEESRLSADMLRYSRNIYVM